MYKNLQKERRTWIRIWKTSIRLTLLLQPQVYNKGSLDIFSANTDYSKRKNTIELRVSYSLRISYSQNLNTSIRFSLQISRNNRGSTAALENLFYSVHEWTFRSRAISIPRSQSRTVGVLVHGATPRGHGAQFIGGSCKSDRVCDGGERGEQTASAFHQVALSHHLVHRTCGRSRRT